MFNRFNLDDQYKEVTTNKENTRPIDKKTLRLMAGVTIIFIGLLVFLGIDYLLNDKRLTFRDDNSKPLVYTYYKSEKANQEIPYFNVKNKDLNQINKNITDYVKPYLNKEKVKISYDYDTSGIVLSLVVKIYDEENYKVKFRSYNVNIEEEKLLSDEYLINYYSLDSSQIKQKVKSQLKTYYDEEVGNYFSYDEIKFDNYLSMRLIDSIDTTDYAYYIKNGKLTAYVPFNPFSIYGEDRYFKDKHFNFVLEEAPAE